MVKQFGLSRRERLHYQREFRKIITSGNKIYQDFFHIYWKTTDQRRVLRRLGLVVSRKVGKATQRNRIKRWIREFFRLNKWHLPPGTDIIISPRSAVWQLNHQEFDEHLKNIWEKINEKNN